jgi:nucleotide-binding universal stress UspA family protein/K+/H+ antiporter YhaU regulatory subunit KhtT
MDHPVVVGYNGKTPAEEALVWAANEATQRGLPLVVLYAANYPGMTLPPGDGLLEFSPGALDAAEEVTARGVVEAKAAHLDLLEVWGETTVTSPAQALVDASSRASLVVVGSRGRGTVLGALLGTVSFAVAGRAACPVVVVKRESGTRLIGPDHRVVVGTDGSPPASAAVRFAADFANSRSAALHVICSTGDDPLSIIDQQQLRHSAEEILQNVCTDLQRTHPQLTPVTHVADGAPEQALIDASTAAGLVVVGSRGRGAFQGMVAGSVSYAVIHGAQCPVAVVRDTASPDESGSMRVADRTAPGRHTVRAVADVIVQVQRLPGVGWRYTVPADQGRQLVIVVEDAGARHLVLVDPGLDNPFATVRLPNTWSSVVAALLAGARFHIEDPREQVANGGEPDQAVIEVLEIRSASPAVGRLPGDVIRELGLDAALLGVTRDRTAEPVEANAQRPIEIGDKLVVAVRRSGVDSVRSAV